MTNKIQPTDEAVGDYLDTVEPARRREDSRALLSLFERITGEPSVMWGSSMIGFGRYHYKYDSGREGDFFRAGFAPRKANLSIHILPNLQNHGALLARLGKHKAAVSCVYVNKLADIDMSVLETLIADAFAEMARLYPD